MSGPWTYYSRRHPDEVDEADWVDVHAPDGSPVRIEGPVFQLTEWTEDGHPTWLMHEHSWTVTPDGEHVEVDVGMVPVLHAIWRLGFQTMYSCEGSDREHAYVMFPTEAERDRFASEVLAATPHRAANRSVYVETLTLLREALGARSVAL